MRGVGGLLLAEEVLGKCGATVGEHGVDGYFESLPCGGFEVWGEDWRVGFLCLVECGDKHGAEA